MQLNVSGRNATAIGLIALALGGTFVGFAAFAAWAGRTVGGGMMGSGMMGSGMMAPFWFPLFALFPLMLLSVVGYTVIRSITGKRESETDTHSDDAPTDPVERLRERYVAGELTEAEFERALDRALDESDNSGAESTPEETNGRVTATENR